jgi:hypothetical protein
MIPTLTSSIWKYYAIAGADLRFWPGERPWMRYGKVLRTEEMNVLKPSLALVIVFGIQAEPQLLPIDPHERQALLELYKTTDGDHWKRKEGWGSNASPCEWYGVRCGLNALGGEPRRIVEGLALADNNLRGTLPRSLFS